MNKIYTFIFTFFVLMISVLECYALQPIQENEKTTVSKGANDGFIVPDDSLYKNEPVKFTLKEFVKLVKTKNQRIIIQQLDYEISKESVKNAQSIFEPQFKGSYIYQERKLKNSLKDKSLLFSGSNTTDERTNNYNASVEGLLSTGAQVSMGYTLEDLKDMTLSTSDQYISFLGINITQPLLKNAGSKATMANINVAKLDSEAALQAYRQQMMKVVSGAIAGCWDYYAACEKYKVRVGSVNVAKKILDDNRERVKLGKMAETEVFEALAGLATRQSLKVRARQDYISAMNNIRTFIASSEVESGIKIDFSEDTLNNLAVPDYKKSLQKTFKFRPEYLSTLKKIEREKIRIAYAKNQRWPQLDLKGSYGLNGLGNSLRESYADSYNGNYKTWSVGAELVIPLSGGMKTRSELAAARHRKKQALMELKSIEVALVNIVDTAVESVMNTSEQVRQYGDVEKLNKRLLDVELERLKAGISNSRDVLEKEENLNKAKDARIESFVENKKAELSLELAQGTLLKDYGVDIMEVKK